MTSSTVVSAFVNTHSARPLLAIISPVTYLATSAFMTNASSPSPSHVVLHAVNPHVVDACVCFFEGVKTPATLIAGSSLAALFTFTREVKETYNISKTKVMLLRIYHVFSLLSFCLSLTTVLTSQAASTSLLLNDKQVLASKSVDAYTFLRNFMNLEFLLTRWTFLASLLSFLVSTTVRMLVEFGLFSQTRRLAGTMVVSMMLAVTTSILSFVNTSQTSWPNLGCMTKELGSLLWKRAYIMRHPLQIASLAFIGIAALCSLKFLFPWSIEYDQMLDNERYT